MKEKNEKKFYPANQANENKRERERGERKKKEGGK